MSWAVAKSLTLHKLATTRVAPAYMKPRVKPIKPSPLICSPSPVWQPLRTTSSGTPPAGSPNYFSVVAQFLNVVSVYKLHADWNNISTSTFSGPFLSLTATSWSQLLAANQTEQSPGNKLDTLYFRLMVQNQYTNIGGVESLWN